MGALELGLTAQQSRTLEMPRGFQPIILEGDLSPKSARGGHLSEVNKEEERAAKE